MTKDINPLGMQPNTNNSQTTGVADNQPAGTTTDNQTTADVKKFAQIVPEQYRSKDYLKDLLELPLDNTAYDQLFKKLDGAERLIGTKIGLPKEDAPDTDWEQYFSKVRPQSPDAYEIVTKEGGKVDDETAKTLKTLFHKAGLTNRQAKILQNDFNEMIYAKNKEALEAQKKLDKEFEELTANAFGADGEKVLTRANTMLKELTPDNLKPHLERLSNEALVILSGVLNTIYDKYISEDQMRGPDTTKSTDTESLREQARKLLASREYQDPFNPKHDETVKKVGELYKIISGQK